MAISLNEISSLTSVQMKELTTLIISLDDLIPVTFSKLLNASNKLATCTNLQTLGISTIDSLNTDSDISNEELALCVEALFAANHNRANITTLEISGSNFGDITGNRLVHICNMITHLPNLEVLGLVNNKFFAASQDVFRDLGKALEKCSMLKTIYCHDNFINLDTAPTNQSEENTIIEANALGNFLDAVNMTPNLETLELPKIPLTNTVLPQFCEAIVKGKTIKTLNLLDADLNDIDNDGTLNMIAYIQEHSSSLEKVILSENEMFHIQATVNVTQLYAYDDESISSAPLMDELKENAEQELSPTKRHRADTVKIGSTNSDKSLLFSSSNTVYNNTNDNSDDRKYQFDLITDNDEERYKLEKLT